MLLGFDLIRENQRCNCRARESDPENLSLARRFLG